MKKQTAASSLRRMGLLIACLSAASYSSVTLASEYCSSPKLYATNIKASCDQYGVNGMQTLYQSSEFIKGLTPVEQSAPIRRINGKALKNRNEAS